jgi:hypothetical protein
MPEFYNSYCSYVFILGEEDTILQYNLKLLKKKKKETIESPYQLATIASTSYITLAFCKTHTHTHTHIYMEVRNQG